MISIIENSYVEKKKWISHDEMMDITIIAESTPGPIAINCATYVGYIKAKLIGAIVATLGIVLPSFIIIYLVSVFMDNFFEIEIIASAFKGIKIGVGLLILDVGLTMLKKMKKNKISKSSVSMSIIILLLINFMSLNISTIALCCLLELLVYNL